MAHGTQHAGKAHGLGFIRPGGEQGTGMGQRRFVGVGAFSKQYPGFLQRFAGAGDAGGGIKIVKAVETHGQQFIAGDVDIGGIDPAAGKHQRTPGKRELFAALHQQIFGHAARPFAGQNHGGSLDGNGFGGFSHAAMISRVLHGCIPVLSGRAIE